MTNCLRVVLFVILETTVSFTRRSAPRVSRTGVKTQSPQPLLRSRLLTFRDTRRARV